MSKKKPKKLIQPETGGTNLQFKLLSAIGIIIIVAGHCYDGGIRLAYEWFPAYSFNIALFIFVSGYFYKDDYENNPFKYIFKRVKRLVLPAYLWNIAYGLFLVLMTNFGYSYGVEVNPYNLFLMPFVDGEAFLFNLGSWFVYPLFFVCVINVLFRKLLGLIKLKSEILILIIYLTVGIIGISLANDGNNTGFMKLVVRVMFFLPCYQFGKFYKEILEEKDNLNSIAYFAILFGIQLILLSFFYDPTRGAESYKGLEYFPSSMTSFNHGPILPYVTALTGIAFWLRISKLLTPAIKGWKFIRLISDNTYSIMIHQMIGYMSVNWLFYLISIMTPMCADFNTSLMKTSFWYHYLPNGLTQYGMLYLVGGLFVPIGIKKLCDLCYKPIKKILKREPSR